MFSNIQEGPDINNKVLAILENKKNHVFFQYLTCEAMTAIASSLFFFFS